MLFNSVDFAIFLPIVFAIYWIIGSKRLNLQNLFIVIASYFFYSHWDWRFLALILFSTIVDFSVGLQLHKESKNKTRKLLLATSIIVNLGLLGFFKYFNFFIDNFTSVFSFFGMTIKVGMLKIILPVGISFYTFQTLSYTIDIYRKRIEPTKNFISFAAFVSFFPQLVAGPIERASHLLPQFNEERKFNYNIAVDGLRQILWGIFKKIVIADNCAEYVDLFFENPSEYSGSSLVLGAIFFSFQIYGDFSGYTDIAIGTSRLFGFDLKQNFNYPYFARDIAEFWRRWHISLTTWFRDYLYIPLGGSRVPLIKQIRNVFIVFIVSAFWHGANWTFFAWGVLHSIFFLPLLLSNKNRNHIDSVAKGRKLPSLKEFLMILSTFCLTTIAWIFFRADNLSHAFLYFSEIFSLSLFEFPEYYKERFSLVTLALCVYLLIIEWIGRDHKYALEKIGQRWNRPLRWAFYSSIVFLLGMYAHTNETPFVYFQF